jgi:hypothetical protein
MGFRISQATSHEDTVLHLATLPLSLQDSLLGVDLNLGRVDTELTCQKEATVTVSFEQTSFVFFQAASA